ncbi:class I mannose-6-phosphate isomerase [Megamonas rupellensis]|uniref:class I mannose-6-phosphate isomerase n=1 Tax=Megamonas rupellensis TaxID=491921 RepID=UPI00241C7DC2|nr:class I mannose-6-phosphate isomerase [Megamonas rupellensis]
MLWEDRQSNYDKYPKIKIKEIDELSSEAYEGYADIVSKIKATVENLHKEKVVIVLDYYHGVRVKELQINLIEKLNPVKTFYAEEAKLPEKILFKKLARNITDDRVFGVLSVHKINEFYDELKIEALKKQIDEIKQGLIIVYGIGASLVTKGDILIYGDLARWEIQQRFRSHKLDNWGVGNYDEDILRKYKRAYFIEWRVLDRHKREVFEEMDFLIDTNKKNNPKMITRKAFYTALEQAVNQPFRLVPYFDEGVWGGTWMEKVCDLKRVKNNFAWCFDGVPEENSLYLDFKGVIVEIPAIDLVFVKAKKLLGEKVYARFGAEFPIRFDFLDTMNGGNLSLQVHPIIDYIQQNFGMHYTQDESYYILDAKDDACVYLGIKEDVDKNDLISALKDGQQGKVFEADKYINKFKVKKHDHISIPAGTIHCSGKNSMVLEISSTPYIFTMKLWDWGRVGLDGLPRPVHLEHGEKVIQYDRKTKWVEKNLLHQEKIISQTDGILEEKTGLNELEFIETRRHWFDRAVKHYTNGSVNVLNLIEGEEAIVTSPENVFAPFVVHYAETFIIPENIKEYIIAPYGKSKGQKIATLKAYVRV